MSLIEFINASSRDRKPLVNESLKRVLGTLTDSTVPDSLLPVEVEASDWITLSSPERLAKTFMFLDFDSVKYFLDEILDHQERVNHHAELIIDHRSVRVETYTRDIDQVTEQDTSLAKFCDEVYSDIAFIRRNRDERP